MVINEAENWSILPKHLYSNHYYSIKYKKAVVNPVKKSGLILINLRVMMLIIMVSVSSGGSREGVPWNLF